MGEPAGRRARRVALIPLFGLIFWLTALMASSVPGLLVLGVNVHGLPPTSYAGGPSVALAPLSQKIIEEARQDRRLANGAPPSANPSANPPAEPSGGPPPSSTHPGASPAGTSSPVTTGGSAPSPTPTPSATPAPIVSILPTPLPTILPSPTPTAVRSAITGQVLDEVTHLGIAAATVAISGGSSTLTDVNGNFSFSVNAGTYTMTASATGYTSASQTVTVNAHTRISATAIRATAPSKAIGNTSAPTAARSPAVICRITLPLFPRKPQASQKKILLR